MAPHGTCGRLLTSRFLRRPYRTGGWNPRRRVGSACVFLSTRARNLRVLHAQARNGNQARRRVFEGVDGIVAVFYSSFRHLMLVDFVTRKAAHKSHGKISGRRLKNCHLKLAFFCNDKEELSPWAKHGTSLCIEGFDSTLHVDEISSMLARHFGSTSEGIIIPTSLAGSCIGKAYIKCGSWCYFSEALNLDGSNLGGHTLRVNECPGGSKFWHGHITPNGPVTGKRTVFNDDSDNE